MENDLLMRGLAAWEDLVSQCGNIDFQDGKWQAFEHGGNGIAQGDTLSQLLCNMAVLWETSDAKEND